MLLRRRLYYLREIDQLFAPARVTEITLSLLPAPFKLHQRLHQLRVVLQLRIHYLNVLIVSSEQLSQLHKRLSYLFRQFPHSMRLRRTYSSRNALRRCQNIKMQVIASLALWVSYSVDLANDAHKPFSDRIVIS